MHVRGLLGPLPKQKSWTLDHRCFPSFAWMLIKHCTNFGGSVVSVLERTWTGWWGVGLSSSDPLRWWTFVWRWYGCVRGGQILAINSGENALDTHFESDCPWMLTSLTSNLLKVVKHFVKYHGLVQQDTMVAERLAMIGALVQQHLPRLQHVITNPSEVLWKRYVQLYSQNRYVAKPT